MRIAYLDPQFGCIAQALRVGEPGRSSSEIASATPVPPRLRALPIMLHKIRASSGLLRSK